MMVPGWTVRESLTKSICHLREHYLKTSERFMLSTSFLEKMKWASVLSHFFSCFVGLLGTRSPVGNTVQRAKDSLEESIYSNQVHHQLYVSESF